MPVLNLPEPESWAADGRRSGWVIPVVMVLVGLEFIFGTRAALRGDYFLAVMLFGLAVPFVLALFIIQFVGRGRSSSRADFDSTGTSLRSDPKSRWLGMLVFASCIPLGIYYVVFTLSGDLVMFDHAHGRRGSLVSMAFVTVLSAWGLIGAWRRRDLGYLKLTPVGIEIADVVRTRRVDWSDIVAVGDYSESKKTRKAIVLNRADGGETVIESVGFYLPHGAGFYWMVRHYWKHPDDRSELIDGYALERLHESRFDLSA